MQQMNQNPQNLNIETTYRTSLIVWFALLSSQFMFLVVIFLAKPKIFEFDFSKSISGDNPIMVIALAVLGISTFLLSFVLRSKFIQQAAANQQPALIQTAMIIGCSLCESITLFGLVLAFAIDYQYFFLWFALGILGVILHFPRRDNFIDASYKK
jgi:F0F1-type ATP synthase membrane subunit c/vacuolar-type H+-ATPase subunit K